MQTMAALLIFPEMSEFVLESWSYNFLAMVG
jgi:hypothetical protein